MNAQKEHFLALMVQLVVLTAHQVLQILNLESLRALIACLVLMHHLMDLSIVFHVQLELIQ